MLKNLRQLIYRLFRRFGKRAKLKLFYLFFGRNNLPLTLRQCIFSNAKHYCRRVRGLPVGWSRKLIRQMAEPRRTVLHSLRQKLIVKSDIRKSVKIMPNFQKSLKIRLVKGLSGLRKWGLTPGRKLAPHRAEGSGAGFKVMKTKVNCLPTRDVPKGQKERYFDLQKQLSEAQKTIVYLRNKLRWVWLKLGVTRVVAVFLAVSLIITAGIQYFLHFSQAAAGVNWDFSSSADYTAGDYVEVDAGDNNLARLKQNYTPGTDWLATASGYDWAYRTEIKLDTGLAEYNVSDYQVKIELNSDNFDFKKLNLQEVISELLALWLLQIIQLLLNGKMLKKKMKFLIGLRATTRQEKPALSGPKFPLYFLQTQLKIQGQVMQ